MPDRFSEFLMHPATLMGAGIMAGSDPTREGLGGVGLGIMSASDALREQRLAEMNALAARAGMPDYSKTPTYFRDPETGEFRIGQLSPTGEVHFPEVPQGLEAVRPVTQIDYGSGIRLQPYGSADPRDPMAGVIQRDIAPEQEPMFRREQAAATAAGREAGTQTEQARRRLPIAMVDAKRTLSRLNQLRSHDALAAATGASSWLPVIRGTGRADFEARMNQITGGAFLQAFETLKGGGQITQNEGEKATQAIARMSQATSEEAFFAAMDDYAEAIQDGITKLQIQAGAEQELLPIPWRETGQAQQAPAPTMAPSTTRMGRRQRREQLRSIREKYGR